MGIEKLKIVLKWAEKLMLKIFLYLTSCFSLEYRTLLFILKKELSYFVIYIEKRIFCFKQVVLFL